MLQTLSVSVLVSVSVSVQLLESMMGTREMKGVILHIQSADWLGV